MIVENKIPTKMVVTDYPFKFPSAEDFAKTMVSLVGGQMIPTLRWANGIVFYYCDAAHESETLWKLTLDGTRVVHDIRWAEMTEYKKTIKIEGFNIEVPILDVSSDKMTTAIVEAFVNLYKDLEVKDNE